MYRRSFSVYSTRLLLIGEPPQANTFRTELTINLLELARADDTARASFATIRLPNSASIHKRKRLPCYPARHQRCEAKNDQRLEFRMIGSKKVRLHITGSMEGRMCPSIFSPSLRTFVRILRKGLNSVCCLPKKSDAR